MIADGVRRLSAMPLPSGVMSHTFAAASTAFSIGLSRFIGRCGQDRRRMAAVALALASSLAWGVADFLGGLQSRRRALLAVLFVGQAAGLASMAVALALRGEGPPGGAEGG